MPRHPVAFVEDYEDPTLNEIPAPRPNMRGCVTVIVVLGIVGLVTAGVVGYTMASSNNSEPPPIITEEVFVTEAATEEIVAITIEPTLGIMPSLTPTDIPTATDVPTATPTIETLPVQSVIEPTQVQQRQQFRTGPGGANYTIYNIPTETVAASSSQPSTVAAQPPAAHNPPAYDPPAAVEPPPVAAPTLGVNAVVFDPPARTNNNDLDRSWIEVVIPTQITPITGTAICFERDPDTGVETPCR